MVDRRRARREHGDAAPLERNVRPQPQLDPDHRYVLELADRRSVASAEHDHDVGDEHAVGVQVRGRVLSGADDEHPPVDVDRRHRRAAPVEDRDVRLQPCQQLGVPVSGAQHLNILLARSQ